MANTEISFQAVVKKWDEIGIEGYDEVSHYAQCLAYLPAENFDEGFQILRDNIAEINEQVGNFRKFELYMKRTWAPLKEIISVYKRPITTNNLCERYHRELNEKMGAHPELWLMLGLKRLFSRDLVQKLF